jgi:putative sterol carrier protein
VARYLSGDWIDAVGAAAATSETLREASRGVRLAVQQRVTGGPDGDVAYHVVLDDGTVSVRPGDADRPDVTFVQDHATAVAVATGELPAQTAFMTGRLRVAGDVQLLMERRDALAGLDDALRTVRAQTEYR